MNVMFPEIKNGAFLFFTKIKRKKKKKKHVMKVINKGNQERRISFFFTKIKRKKRKKRNIY